MALHHSALPEIWPVWCFLCLWGLLEAEYPKQSILAAFLRGGKGCGHGGNV